MIVAYQGLFRNTMACLQPSLDCQSLQCVLLPLTALWCVLSSWLQLAADSWFRTNESLASCFIGKLVSYFNSWNIECPETQISLTLLNNDSRLSSVIVSATDLDEVFAVFNARNAARLSEHIVIDASYSVCKKVT